jgi:hypothetical protein
MNRLRKDERGMALVTATLLLAVGILVLSALSLRVVNQHNQVNQFEDYTVCFEGLEAAFAESMTEIFAGNDGNIGVDGWEPFGSGELILSEGGGETTGYYQLPSFDDDEVTPQTLASLPGVEYFAYAVNWSTDGYDNNGDGAVDVADEIGMYSIHISARVGVLERSAEVVLGGEDVNVWRNAVFAGAGQAGGLINGNVAVHGSVHLLGDNLSSGASAIAALDLGGTSLIHNNYLGAPADLVARVPALSTTTFNGEAVETLEAKLRVRSGLVGLSGNSEIGEEDVFGDSDKETMKATYVNDGWTGNSVVDDGDRGDPLAVWSDNGWDELYDLGNLVSMPYYNDDWRDPTTGNTVYNAAEGRNYTHDEYFSEMLAGEPYVGDIVIEADEPFYYNATRPADPDPANLQADDNYILFDPDTNLMEINGQIEIDGNLEFTRGGGSDDTISYTGRAALLVRGDVSIDTHMLSVNADGTTADSFPINNILGVMAENNMTVGSTAQLTLMGAFYAQGTVSSSKQTVTMGTYVGSYFNMGTNVPEIYQVPWLADYLPLGMIGGYPITNWGSLAWREV